MKGHMSTVSPLSELDLQSFFFPRTLQRQFPETCLFIQVSVAARYRLTSISKKDNSTLLRFTSVHSFQLCYIAELLRERRATCDLLSLEGGGFKLNDAACAAHCLTKWSQGYRGGRCVNGICVCRK